jgi:hypothetical protein
MCARAISTTACCYLRIPMFNLESLVTSFERFGVCRFTAAAAIAVHPARKISSAETAARLRPADADDSKPGTHMIEHLDDGLADHPVRRRLACRRHHRLSRKSYD